MRTHFASWYDPKSSAKGDTLPAPAITGGLVVLAALFIAVVSPLKAIALALGAVFVVAAFWRPELIIGGLALYTPFEPFLLKFVPDELYLYARYFSEGLIYLLVLVVLYRVLVRRSVIRSTPIDLPFIFFCVVMLASLIINAVSPVIGLLGIRQIVRFIILFFVTIYLDPEERFIKNLTWALFTVMLFQAALGVVQSVAGGRLDEYLIPSERRFYESIQLTSGVEQFWSPGTRVFATMGRYDQLGTFLCFFALLAIGLMYRSSDRTERRRLGILALAVMPALALTLSRASWFGFALGLFVIGGILMKDWRVRYGYAAVIVAAVGYLAVTGLTVRYLIDSPEQTTVERFFEAFSYERWRGEYYGLGRLFWIVQTPTVVVRSSPLFGVGPGQYGGGAVAALGNTHVYEQLNLPFGVYGSEGYIDNNWFSLWGETGTIGLGFYLWMFIALGSAALVVAHRSKDPFLKGLALGYVGCILAVSFQALLATYLEVRTLALYFWLYSAFILVLARKEGVSVIPAKAGIHNPLA